MISDLGGLALGSQGRRPLPPCQDRQISAVIGGAYAYRGHGGGFRSRGGRLPFPGLGRTPGPRPATRLYANAGCDASITSYRPAPSLGLIHRSHKAGDYGEQRDASIRCLLLLHLQLLQLLQLLLPVQCKGDSFRGICLRRPVGLIACITVA